ncbi:MAG: GNAT family N-acetyltransferase [Nocardioidaceae bacterium]|nr:GNAT family N-acetyltransferase [Nocardioidaceae bacterium]
MRTRLARAADLPAVLAMNQGELDAVGPLDDDRLQRLVDLAEQVLVADDAGAVAGFVVTLAPGTAYASPNYRWFGERYDDFCYLDRVVVARTHLRRGLGTTLYDAAEAAGSPHGQMALEVYAEPPNEVSLAFHAARGYTEVGRSTQDNGKVSAMFVKPLDR